MLNHEMYLKNISDSLALLSRQVEMRNAINLYDINIVAEDFYAPLLNIIFGYDLRNVNVSDKNVAALDLADEVNRVAIQVTSDHSSTKIKHTIEEYIQYKYYEQYDRLIVLLLTRKPAYRTVFDTKGLFEFDVKKDVLDVEDLMKVIRGKEITVLQALNQFLEQELNQKAYILQSTQASEVDTIIDLIEYITQNRKLSSKREAIIDPEYKIYNRFRTFASRLTNEYTTLVTLYGEPLETVFSMLQVDEVQELIMMLYLQDVSVQFLDQAENDPLRALNDLVHYFEEKLSGNGKHYDRAAIKFYLVNEMIKCNVFPNERDEYDGNEQ